MTTNNETDNGKKALGIYIHIPFCRSRCRYCGFYSRAAEDSLDSGKAMEQYIWKLIGEIAEKGAMYRRQYVADSVFIGGGTPSMMPAAGVEAVLGAVREHFVLSSDAEVTLEANPDTVDLRPDGCASRATPCCWPSCASSAFLPRRAPPHRASVRRPCSNTVT